METLVTIGLIGLLVIYIFVWPKIKARMIDGAGRAMNRKQYEAADELLKYGNRVYRSGKLSPEQVKEATRYAASTVGDVLIEESGTQWYMKIGKNWGPVMTDKAQLVANFPDSRDGDSPVVASMTISGFSSKAGSANQSLLKVGKIWELVEERLKPIDPALVVERGETNLGVTFG